MEHRGRISFGHRSIRKSSGAESVWHQLLMHGEGSYQSGWRGGAGGGMQHDGLGLLSESYSQFPQTPDVKFTVLDEDTETEITSQTESPQ